jgi:hypothetical protein
MCGPDCGPRAPAPEGSPLLSQRCDKRSVPRPGVASVLPLALPRRGARADWTISSRSSGAEKHAMTEVSIGLRLMRHTFRKADRRRESASGDRRRRRPPEALLSEGLRLAARQAGQSRAVGAVGPLAGYLWVPGTADRPGRPLFSIEAGLRSRAGRALKCGGQVELWRQAGSRAVQGRGRSICRPGMGVGRRWM